MTPPPAPRIVGREPLPTAVAGGWPQGAEPETWLLSVSGYTAAMDPGAPGKILDAGERERAAKFLRAEDRERYTAAHMGLRELLAAYLGLAPADVPFTRESCPGCGGPHGRPAVSGTPLHFNMSHAGDLVLFAVAGTPVGVDVEKLQPASVVDQVAESLHPKERAELDALPQADRPAAFARCWTRKEAYLMGIGTGLTPVPVGPWTMTDIPVAGAVSGGFGYAAAMALLSSSPHV